MVFCSGYRKPYKYTIDAGKDAFYHNNVGLNYLKDRIYYAAIQEFKIAIQLSPNTARVCFEDAIKLYGLNFKYYLNLAECYKKLGITNTKIKEYSISTNPYDKIMLGVLYIQSGSMRKGVILLDELCSEEPDLLITPAIRQYLKEVTSKM